MRQKSMAIIEIGLFYDQSFHDMFSNKLNDFIKTVLRQIQIIFEYPSMKSQIRLVVTRIIKIEQNQVLTTSKRMLDYFDKLCWFQFINYWEKTKDYDLALFFSGTTFFRKPEDIFVTRGLAQIHGVCNNWGRNCALSTVLNFMDSWYVAHEIGHSLGAYHDLYQYNCEPGIMGGGADQPHVWSECTNNAINRLLVHQNGSCLFNEPKSFIWDLKSEQFLPSNRYNADNQCSLSFGSQYKRYLGDMYDLLVVNPCNDLWCFYDMIKVSANCPLEGTDCYLNKNWGKCFVGKCVLKNRQ